MNAQTAWLLFTLTGAPEYYLLYQSCLEEETASKSA